MTTTLQSTEVASVPTVRADYQVLSPLSADEYAALKEDIRLSGRVRDPIIKNASGSILDGHHRTLAWQELRAEGVELPEPPALIRQDLTDDDPVACRAAARQYNLQRRHLDNAAKRVLIADQLRETPERSDGWIAEQLGVAQGTVSKARHALVRGEQIPYVDVVVTRNGSRFPYQKGQSDVAIEAFLRRAPETPDKHISEQLGSTPDPVARIRKRLEQAGQIPIVRRPGSRDNELDTAIETALRDAPGCADRDIADQLDCSYRPVMRIRKRLEQAGQIPVVPVRDRRAQACLVDPTDIPIAEQDTGALRRQHVQLRDQARAVERELRTRAPLPKPEPPPLGQPAPAGITIVVADASDLGAQLEDGSVDLIVTSPPHCLDQPYADGIRDDWPYEQFLGPGGVAAGWARELYRIARPVGGRLCLQTPIQSFIGGEPRLVLADWRDRLAEAGWHYRGLILWAKSGANLAHSPNNGKAAYGTPSPSAPVVHIGFTEAILVMYRGERWSLARGDDQHDLAPFWPQLSNGQWEISAQRRARDADGLVLHPAPFPVELPQRLITLFSFRDAVICDPFLGSGTTAIAAHRLRRRCFGFDLSPTYVRQSLERLAQETAS